MISKSMSPITIIMYHYIRDLPNTPYPDIKGLTIKKFKGQLEYITKHYTVCGFEQIFTAIHGRESLPKNPCVLTFDDGIIDHYHNVFPILKEQGLIGCFFPSGKAIENRKILDVHKIHFILASMKNHQEIIKKIFMLIKQFREQYDIPEDHRLYEIYAKQSRYDKPEIVFIKRILQKGLPKSIRSSIVDNLFKCYVSDNEKAFARELYMDIAQLRSMARNGMEIGGHGYKHVWLETLKRNEQAKEICLTYDLLTKIYNYKPSHWVMSYPFSSFNNITIELLKKTNCDFGLTTQIGLVSDLSKPMELERFDTNDFPFSGNANICKWTQKVYQ